MLMTFKGPDIVKAWDDNYEQIITSLAVATAYGAVARQLAGAAVPFGMVDNDMHKAITTFVIALCATTGKEPSVVQDDIVGRVMLMFNQMDTSA